MRADRRILLFAYGTLQDAEIQRAVFGRTLAGRSDRLPGFVRDRIRIGRRTYPILRPAADPSHVVDGTVFEIDATDLAAADAYEGPHYVRTELALASGRSAFAYVAPPTG